MTEEAQVAADPEEEPVVEVDTGAVTEEAPVAADPEEEPVVEVVVQNRI